MAVMRRVGGHARPAHAHVREVAGKYVIELDVADFTDSELTIEVLGPVVTVRGDQQGAKEDEGVAFRLHERLEESFRLPDDADADRLEAFFKHGSLQLRAPRLALKPRQVPLERQSSLVNPDAEPC